MKNINAKNRRNSEKIIEEIRRRFSSNFFEEDDNDDNDDFSRKGKKYAELDGIIKEMKTRRFFFTTFLNLYAKREKWGK